MMSKRSRIVVLVASIALGLMYVLPVWRIDLEAPQYPEGIGMVIRINTIEGKKEHDLSNINNLNHYIGMKRIEPESIPELRVMPVVVGVLMLLGGLVALVGRRWLLNSWVALFVGVSLVGVADFWRWEYDYGHNLDEENAIIKIPGMSYQPPLIGSKQILNFTAHSWPGGGGWAAMAAAAAAVLVAFGEERRRRAGNAPSGGRASGSAGALVLAALVLSACGEPRPRPIVVGSDACSSCLMSVGDAGHATEVVTRTGKTYVFDSVECLASFLLHAPEDLAVHSVWVTDFSNPGELVAADEAHFLVSSTLKSPMGLGITAFARLEDRDGAVHSFGGSPRDWQAVRDYVAASWPGGRVEKAPHGGHGSTLTPTGT